MKKLQLRKVKKFKNMKITKVKISSEKLFKLHLIKSRTYEYQVEKDSLKNLPYINLAQTFICLKKILQIIFEYHKNNKRILFLDSPPILEKKINALTNHTSLPKQFLMKGILLNEPLIRNLKKNKPSLLQTKNKPDLIVVFDLKSSNGSQAPSLQKGHISRIPTIKLNANLQKQYQAYCYNVPGNMGFTSKNSIDNICFILLNSMLKYFYKPTEKKSKKYNKNKR